MSIVILYIKKLLILSTIYYVIYNKILLISNIYYLNFFYLNIYYLNPSLI